MIFFDSKLEIDLIDFGIQIPIIKRASIIADKFPNIVKEVDFKFPTSLKPHSDEYIEKLNNTKLLCEEVKKTFELINDDGSFHRYDPKFVKRSLDELGQILIKRSWGTHYASQIALKDGFSFYLGGGMHHAFESQGRGFCLVHDVVMSAFQYSNKRIGIIDLDVHKGDGSAVMAKDISWIKTFSIHMKNGWPLDQPDHNHPSFTPSDWDIPIGAGKESEYLPRLEISLNKLPQFDLVYILAGTDPYEKDQLPSSNLINLTLEQMKQRDLMVYNFFKKHHTPQAWVLSGGYGEYSTEPTIEFIKSII